MFCLKSLNKSFESGLFNYINRGQVMNYFHFAIFFSHICFWAGSGRPDLALFGVGGDVDMWSFRLSSLSEWHFNWWNKFGILPPFVAMVLWHILQTIVWYPNLCQMLDPLLLLFGSCPPPSSIIVLTTIFTLPLQCFDFLWVLLSLLLPSKYKNTLIAYVTHSHKRVVWMGVGDICVCL